MSTPVRSFMYIQGCNRCSSHYAVMQVSNKNCIHLRDHMIMKKCIFYQYKGIFLKGKTFLPSAAKFVSWKEVTILRMVANVKT